MEGNASNSAGPWPCRIAGGSRKRESPTKIRLFPAREREWGKFLLIERSILEAEGFNAKGSVEVSVIKEIAGNRSP
jgi:hypothetical protein